jgi:hypothetical protein
MLKRRSTPGDKVHTTRGRYCKIYRISLTKIVLKECKPVDAETSYNSCSGKNKGKRKTM